MPLSLDLAYVASFAVAWPLYEFFIGWPAFLRRLSADPVHARRRAYRMTITQQWLLLALGLVLWRGYGRDAAALGLRVPEGVLAWISAGLVALTAWLFIAQARALSRDAASRAHVRERIAYVDNVLPHTQSELIWFLALSLTAGVCEEFLFRGYLLTTLTPWLGTWGAAALGVVIFGLAHAYQGRRGIVSTGIVGALMTLVVVLTHSLLPAMALHALIDAGSGVSTWIARRDADANAAPANA